MNRATPTAIADLQLAILKLRKTHGGFVIVKDQHVVASSQDHGVGSLIAAVEQLRQTRLFGAALADTVVGRAAVLMALWGGVGALHAELISDGAVEEATKHGLSPSYRVRIATILNHRRDGPCPFELATAEAADRGLSLDEIVSRLRALSIATAQLRRLPEDHSAV